MSYQLVYQFRPQGRKVHKTFSTHVDREAFIEQLLKDGCYSMWSKPREESIEQKGDTE